MPFYHQYHTCYTFYNLFYILTIMDDFLFSNFYLKMTAEVNWMTMDFTLGTAVPQADNFYYNLKCMTRKEKKTGFLL